MRTVETAGRVEYTAVGHVTNLAARLKGVAPAGGIAISEDTRRLAKEAKHNELDFDRISARVHRP
jgi:class 3 adenylate cyclase